MSQVITALKAARIRLMDIAMDEGVKSPLTLLQIEEAIVKAEERERLSLRDHFAASALQGILAHPGTATEPAIDAYMHADHMLAARSAK